MSKNNGTDSKMDKNAMLQAYIDKFGLGVIIKEVVGDMDLPFEVSNIRKAEDMLRTVSKGCFVKAMQLEAKAQAEDNPKEEAPKKEKAEKPRKEKVEETKDDIDDILG